MNILTGLLTLCLNGRGACDRYNSPRLVHYEQGKSCYVNGTFFESCPPFEVRETVMYQR